ncbi:MAG: DNA mismatch endonuclease Vsr [Hyphomicrobiales bacterium]
MGKIETTVRTMTDIVDPARRSMMMARIRSKNTAPEIEVRRAAFALGLRYRLHKKNLPGSPDLVFAKHRTVIFVHGCFWHRHPGCIDAVTPKSRSDFWLRKFEANKARDVRVCDQLRAMGWRTVIIWECETTNQLKLRQMLTAAFDVPSRERQVGV